MADGNILSDFGIDLLEEEIDDVIFQTNEFLTDATFTGSQGPFWWILQMCMALAALFAIIMAAGMAYKMMVKHEPLDVMKLFRPLAVSLILCWWYPPADTGMANSGSNWCFLDFLSYIPNCVGSYTHDLYEAEASQISDKFEEVQELIYVRDTMYTALQAQADVAHTGTSDPNLIEATMEQTGVDEVTNMEKDAAKLWFTSLTSGVIVGIDKIIMLIALVVFRIGWWGYHLLSANSFGECSPSSALYSGRLAPAQMGRCVGEVAHEVSDGAFLRGDALLRGLLRAAAVRHRAVHTGGEPDGNHGERADDGGLPAKQLLLRRLSDGGKHRGPEMPEPRPRPAAWMIPEGDTAFSTRNFGEGVAQQAKNDGDGRNGYGNEITK